MTDSSDLSAFEKFYIAKIEQGLSGSEFLTSDEKALLSYPTKDLSESGKYTFSNADNLTTKCIEALTTAYMQDTKGKNKKQAREWASSQKLYGQRDPRNENELVISKLVLEWWYPLGRSLERKVLALFGKPEW